MSTSVVTVTNLINDNVGVILMCQEWNDEFGITASNINNDEASRDGDMTSENWNYVVNVDYDGAAHDALGSKDYCTHMTNSDLSATAFVLFSDTDDADKNLVVVQYHNTTAGKAKERCAFCGIMGAASSGNTNGTTVQNWTGYMKDKFDRLCRWVSTSDRRVR